MEKIDDCLRCPICLEIPTGVIFQCRNGHQICSWCTSGYKTCPTCRVDYDDPKIRNLAMEALLDALEFDCPYKKTSGCSEKLHRSKLSTHSLECKFRPFHFCKLLGFKKCDFDGHQISSLLLRHLQDFHNITIHQTKDLIINYDDFMSAAHIPALVPGSTKFWPPVIVKIDQDNNGPTFIILAAVQTSHCSWICLYMNDSQEKDDEELCKYQFTFVIKNVFGNEGDHELKWKTAPVSFKKANEILKDPHLTFPVSFIRDHVLFNSPLGVYGSLRLEVEIIKIGNEPVKELAVHRNPLHLRFEF